MNHQRLIFKQRLPRERQSFNMNTKIVTHAKEEGFTLIETLVGLVIFMIVFVAVSQISANSLQDLNQTKRRLTAQYLAEEGIEYVKQVQKSYILQGMNKTQFFDQFVNPNCPDGCEFYIGNTGTAGMGNGVALGNSSFVTGNNGGAGPDQIGVATSVAASPADLSRLRYHTNGLIAQDGLYNTDVADSEYSRVVTIRDVSAPNSEAVEVTSTVYFPSANNNPYSNENAVILVEIIHFNL